MTHELLAVKRHGQQSTKILLIGPCVHRLPPVRSGPHNKLTKCLIGQHVLSTTNDRRVPAGPRVPFTPWPQVDTDPRIRDVSAWVHHVMLLVTDDDTNEPRATQGYISRPGCSPGERWVTASTVASVDALGCPAGWMTHTVADELGTKEVPCPTSIRQTHRLHIQASPRVEGRAPIHRGHQSSRRSARGTRPGPA